jgi:hypothetical protein
MTDFLPETMLDFLLLNIIGHDPIHDFGHPSSNKWEQVKNLIQQIKPYKLSDDDESPSTGGRDSHMSQLDHRVRPRLQEKNNKINHKLRLNPIIIKEKNTDNIDNDIYNDHIINEHIEALKCNVMMVLFNNSLRLKNEPEARYS